MRWDDMLTKKIGTMSIQELMKRERPLIEKIIQDETWLCGERRREPVSHHDQEVVDRVCRIIMIDGAKIRERAEEQ